MPSVSKVNISIVLVTIFIINIFNTSAIDIINGKRSLDSSLFDPIVNKQECDSYYTGNNKICDMNKYLTYPMKQRLGEIMEKSKALPIISCPFKTDGIEFGVFIMSSFNDYHSIKMEQENFDITEASTFYAKLFHEKWEIGNEECNNGILIFLNINDRFIYISTSTYLKMNYISDQYINDIILPSIRPNLKNAEYDEAIIKIMEAITDKCQQQTVDKMIESEEKSKQEKIEQRQRQKEIQRQQERERKERQRQKERERKERQRQEKRERKERLKRQNIDSQNDNYDNHNDYIDRQQQQKQNDGIDIFWTIIIVTVLSIIFLIWFMQWTLSSICCCCGDDDDCDDCCRNPRNVYVYNDEGRPSSQPLQPGAAPVYQPGIVRNNNINRMNASNLRSRNIRNVENIHNVDNVYNTYPKQQFAKTATTTKPSRCDNGGGAGMLFDNNDKLKKEREEKQRKEREKRAQEKKLKEQNASNSKLVDDGKRTSIADGAGMSWGGSTNESSNKSNSSSNVKSYPKLKRTSIESGGGMSWGGSTAGDSTTSKSSSFSSKSSSSPKFKRTDANAGAGGSW